MRAQIRGDYCDCLAPVGQLSDHQMRLECWEGDSRCTDKITDALFLILRCRCIHPRMSTSRLVSEKTILKGHRDGDDNDVQEFVSGVYPTLRRKDKRLPIMVGHSDGVVPHLGGDLDRVLAQVG